MSQLHTRGGGTLRQVRPSPVFLALVATCAVSGWYLWTGQGHQRFAVFLMVISGWLISVCVHEFCHALAALRSGDASVVARGYLTLNPLRYTDPLFTIVLPTVFVLLGGLPLTGGSVWIDRGAIRGRGRHSLVSAAGPLSNVALATGLALTLHSGAVDGAGPSFQAGFAFLAQLQVLAAVLNLLPVPGLDGYGVLEPWLSHRVRRAIAPYAPYAPLALFALLWSPRVNHAFFDLVHSAAEGLGIPAGLASAGYTLFRFWD